MKNEKKIEWSLFKKAVANELTGIELDDFNNWLNASQANRKYFLKAKKFYSETENEENDFYSEYDPDAAFRLFQNYTGKIRNILKPLIGIAATVLIVTSISVLLFVHPFRKNTANEQVSQIGPGKPKATLTLSNGTKIGLDRVDTLKTISDEKSLIEIDSTGIKYERAKDERSELTAMNTLEIPHGGEFRLTLSDGTRVWLNSETRLEYPLSFTGSTREVTLTGEGYFEVSKNPAKPFIVHSGNFSTKVLGTSFNISNYSDDQQHLLTLVEGSVEITGIQGVFDKSFRIEPKQQFIFYGESLKTEIREVDPAMYTAWTKGSFVFDAESMDQIFTKLSRWYDIDVFFINNEAKDEKLTGTLPRFEDFGTILKLMEQVSNAKFEMKGNKIMVK